MALVKCIKYANLSYHLRSHKNNNHNSLLRFLLDLIGFEDSSSGCASVTMLLLSNSFQCSDSGKLETLRQPTTPFADFLATAIKDIGLSVIHVEVSESSNSADFHHCTLSQASASRR